MIHQTVGTWWNLARLVLLCSVAVGVLSLYGTVNAEDKTDSSIYFAVYCEGGGGLSASARRDDRLECEKTGKPPLFDSLVATLATDPKSEHETTTVEADCYPDKIAIPASAPSSLSSIPCGASPDATITIGRTFPAVRTASAAARTDETVSHANISPGHLPVVDTHIATLTIKGIVYGIIGSLALLMIVIAGLRYITADGDPDKTKQARNGVIYVLVGVAVSLAAVAIIGFVVERI